MRLKLQLPAKAGRFHIFECEAVRLVTLPDEEFQDFLNGPHQDGRWAAEPFYWDITDEEYLAQLETKREEITHEILERCRTKRKNLYITGPVALNVAQKFSVHRLCDKEGKHNLANRFVGELMEQLVQDGLLVTRKTRNGPGVRTATDAEISSPLPGQQQMTL